MQHATRDSGAGRSQAREIPLLVLENRQFWQISRTRRPISRARKIMSSIFYPIRVLGDQIQIQIQL
jgi:hypothetical protein